MAADAAFVAYMKTFAFNSGHANANPRVIVVDTFNSARFADPAYGAGTTMRPLPGLFCDGLHYAPPGAWRAAQDLGDIINPILDAQGIASIARLPTVGDGVTWFNDNPLLAGTSGGIYDFSGNGITVSGAAPNAFRVIINSAPAGTIITGGVAALGGALGNEFTLRVQHGSGAGVNITIDQGVTGANLGSFNQAAHVGRCCYRANLAIASGRLIGCYNQVTIGDAGSYTIITDSGYGSGASAGYGNDASFAEWLKNPYADVGLGATETFIGPDIDRRAVATGNPNGIKSQFVLASLAGAAADYTLKLSQWGVGLTGTN